MGETKNIYAKLAKARVLLQEKEIGKSGENAFSHYNYFELKDFLPHINKINADLGLFSMCDINSEMGTLTIIDTDNLDGCLQFSMESAQIDLKGGNKIQNIGAIQTYLRRYLYMLAYEIVDNDIIDSGKEEEKAKGKTKKVEDDLKSLKDTVAKKCQELTSKGKKDQVNAAILTKAKLPNPHVLKNKDDLIYVLGLLEDIEKSL